MFNLQTVVVLVIVVVVVVAFVLVVPPILTLNIISNPNTATAIVQLFIELYDHK